jgi:hypothetical protein
MISTTTTAPTTTTTASAVHTPSNTLSSPPQHTTIPETGTRVRVIARSGSYTGRVLSSAPGQLRIKDGAGMWFFSLNEIISITALAPKPASASSAEQIARAAKTEQIRLIKLFARWP